MPEDEAIKIAALHLEEVAHKWSHHGIVTLGDDQVMLYVEFMERLIECFDKKNP